jgi:hypothetical protein
MTDLLPVDWAMIQTLKKPVSVAHNGLIIVPALLFVCTFRCLTAPAVWIETVFTIFCAPIQTLNTAMSPKNCRCGMN